MRTRERACRTIFQEHGPLAHVVDHRHGLARVHRHVSEGELGLAMCMSMRVRSSVRRRATRGGRRGGGLPMRLVQIIIVVVFFDGHETVVRRRGRYGRTCAPSRDRHCYRNLALPRPRLPPTLRPHHIGQPRFLKALLLPTHIHEQRRIVPHRRLGLRVRHHLGGRGGVGRLLRGLLLGGLSGLRRRSRGGDLGPFPDARAGAGADRPLRDGLGPLGVPEPTEGIR